MNEEKKDRRVKYTQKVIKESFIKLLKEKPVSKITVSEICKNADINRGTFYLHYYDAYSLLESLEKELYVQIENTLKNFSTENLENLLETIMLVIFNNKDICEALLSEHGDEQFFKKVLNLAKNRSREAWKAQNPKITENTIDYFFSFTSSGCIGIIQEWIKKGFSEPPQEIASFITNIKKRKELLMF